MCNKPANPASVICHSGYHTRHNVGCDRAVVTQRRSLLQKSMAGKHQQTGHFPYSFAAFRHIPCLRSDFAICNKISWGGFRLRICVADYYT
jgi:hypothetical protein